MWDRETGKPYTSIEATADFNDLCLYKQSGLLFLANEQPKMQVRRYRVLLFLANEQPAMQVSRYRVLVFLAKGIA
jgi:hypothetical protein